MLWGLKLLLFTFSVVLDDFKLNNKHASIVFMKSGSAL